MARTGCPPRGPRSAHGPLARACAAAAALATALLLCRPWCPTAPAALSEGAFAQAGAGRSPRQQWAAAGGGGRARGRTAVAATLEDVLKSSRTSRYGVNPKLKAFLETEEFRKVVDILAQLRAKGLLAGFLERANAYWVDFDFYPLMESDASIPNIVRKDFHRIWPEELAEERKEAFSQFLTFALRLDQSGLFADVLRTVLPQPESGGTVAKASGAAADQQRLVGMGDEELRYEILERMADTEVAQQLQLVAQGDEALEALGEEVMPAVAMFVGQLERKAATQGIDVGFGWNFAIGAFVVGSLVFGLQLAEVIKLPNPFDDSVELGSSAPSVVFSSTAELDPAGAPGGSPSPAPAAPAEPSAPADAPAPATKPGEALLAE